MADQEKGSKAYDPFEPFRTMRDAYLDSMAKTMVDVVNTEAYAQTTGAMLEGYLSAAAPFREALERSMAQALQQMSLPSRQEVASIAERFTHVEMRLDDMDAKLDRIEKILHQLKEMPLREEAPEPSGTHETHEVAGPVVAAAPESHAPAAPAAVKSVAARRIARKRSAHSAQR